MIYEFKWKIFQKYFCIFSVSSSFFFVSIPLLLLVCQSIYLYMYLSLSLLFLYLSLSPTLFTASIHLNRLLTYWFSRVVLHDMIFNFNTIIYIGISLFMFYSNIITYYLLCNSDLNATIFYQISPNPKLLTSKYLLIINIDTLFYFSSNQ